MIWHDWLATDRRMEFCDYVIYHLPFLTVYYVCMAAVLPCFNPCLSGGPFLDSGLLSGPARELTYEASTS